MQTYNHHHHYLHHLARCRHHYIICATASSSIIFAGCFYSTVFWQQVTLLVSHAIASNIVAQTSFRFQVRNRLNQFFFSRDLDTTKNVCHNFCVCDLTRAQFTVFSEFSNGPHTKVERELVIIPDSIHTYNTLRDTHAREKKRKTYAHLLGPCKGTVAEVAGWQKSGNDNQNNEVIVMKMPRHLWRKRSTTQHTNSRHQVEM